MNEMNEPKELEKTAEIFGGSMDGAMAPIPRGVRQVLIAWDNGGVTRLECDREIITHGVSHVYRLVETMFPLEFDEDIHEALTGIP